MRLLLAFVSALLSVFAQAATSRLEGLIFDASGSIVAGATVLAAHNNTGLRISTTSDGQGAFALLSLPAGSYKRTLTCGGGITGLNQISGTFPRCCPQIERIHMSEKSAAQACGGGGAVPSGLRQSDT